MKHLAHVLLITWTMATLRAEVCGLTIGVMDAFGTSVPYRVQSFRDAKGVEYKDRFERLSAANVPCGSYKYVLARADIDVTVAAIHGEIMVNDVRQWFTLNPDPNLIVGDGGAIFVDSIAPPNYRVAGKLKPAPTGEHVFVRLISIYGQYPRQSVSAAVGGNGSFEFTHILRGKYIFLVVQGESVLSNELVSIESTQPPTLQVNLGSPKPYKAFK